MPKCVAKTPTGAICGKPATTFDREQGGYVCPKHSPKPLRERYLTPDEVAEQLSVSPLTVRKWLRSGELKGVKAGKQWRIKEAVLNDFLKETTEDTGKEG
jgi:excisionase family DNA binding protein